MPLLILLLLTSLSYADTIQKVDNDNISVISSKTVSIDDLKNDYITAQNARDYYQSRMDAIEVQINEAAKQNVASAVDAKTILE